MQELDYERWGKEEEDIAGGVDGGTGNLLAWLGECSWRASAMTWTQWEKTEHTMGWPTGQEQELSEAQCCR